MNGDTTTIYIVKALIPQQVTLDVEVHAAQHRSYPQTSTGNQLFGDFDLGAYRSLGEQSTKALLTADAVDARADDQDATNRQASPRGSSEAAATRVGPWTVTITDRLRCIGRGRQRSDHSPLDAMRGP